MTIHHTPTLSPVCGDHTRSAVSEAYIGRKVRGGGLLALEPDSVGYKAGKRHKTAEQRARQLARSETPKGFSGGKTPLRSNPKKAAKRAAKAKAKR